MRLRSDFWVSAYLRHCDIVGLSAVLRRRGSPEAGGIYVKHDRLDGSAIVYGPAPQADEGPEAGSRRFIRIHKDESLALDAAEDRLRRAREFDDDIWIIEVESRDGDIFLDIVG